VLEISGVTLGVRWKTARDILTIVIHRYFTGIAGAVTNTVERPRAAKVHAVLVAILTDTAVVRIFAGWTFRHAVRSILYVLTAYACCICLT